MWHTGRSGLVSGQWSQPSHHPWWIQKPGQSLRFQLWNMLQFFSNWFMYVKRISIIGRMDKFVIVGLYVSTEHSNLLWITFCFLRPSSFDQVLSVLLVLCFFKNSYRWEMFLYRWDAHCDTFPIGGAESRRNLGRCRRWRCPRSKICSRCTEARF